MPIVPPTRPRYKNVPATLLKVLRDLARGSPASLIPVQTRLFAGMAPSPRVSGKELIPFDSPFIAVFNHYESSTAAAWWGPFLMSGVIARHRKSAERHTGLAEGDKNRKRDGTREEVQQIRWLMAGEWWYPSGFDRLVKQPFTRLLFGRLAQVYGFVRVPPVLEGNSTRGEGFAGVRHALALTQGANPSLVGLAPEGHSGPGGVLIVPPAGTGLFLLHLTHQELPLLPIGWFEDENRALTINFGHPFHLLISERTGRDERDRAAATQAMTAIGLLIPERLWGAYTEEIAGEREGSGAGR